MLGTAAIRQIVGHCRDHAQSRTASCAESFEAGVLQNLLGAVSVDEPLCDGLGRGPGAGEDLVYAGCDAVERCLANVLALRKANCRDHASGNRCRGDGAHSGRGKGDEAGNLESREDLGFVIADEFADRLGTVGNGFHGIFSGSDRVLDDVFDDVHGVAGDAANGAAHSFGATDDGAAHSFGTADNGAAHSFGAIDNGAAQIYGATGNGAAQIDDATENGAAQMSGATDHGAAQIQGATGNGAAQIYDATGNGAAHSFGAADNGAAHSFGAIDNGAAHSFGAADNGAAHSFGAADNGAGAILNHIPNAHWSLHPFLGHLQVSQCD